MKSGMKLIHPGSGRVLAEDLEIPRTMFGRGLGLMFRRRLEPGQGMWIRPCNGIHMFFMRFAIDAVFLDSKDQVRRAYRHLRPWIGMAPIVWGARGVVELPAGTLDGIELPRGEPLRFE